MDRQPLTAIVCDDAPGYRALLSALFADAGVEVDERAASWDEAIRAISARSRDIVVVDLWMPDLDLQALARVRSAVPGATLAVVTALDLRDARARIGELSVDLVLSKAAPPLGTVEAIVSHALGPSPD